MRLTTLALCAALACLAGCVQDNPWSVDEDLLDAELVDAGLDASDVTDADAAPAPPRYVAATVRLDAGLLPDGGRPACPTTIGVLFDDAAPGRAPDGCELQCSRLAHCASHTWDDGSDQCRCLEDDDEAAIRWACVQACRTTQGDLLYYALFDTPVCSEIVPAVTSRFPAFSRACGGRP
jgi:hypothetical protein